MFVIIAKSDGFHVSLNHNTVCVCDSADEARAVVRAVAHDDKSKLEGGAFVHAANAASKKISFNPGLAKITSERAADHLVASSKENDRAAELHSKAAEHLKSVGEHARAAEHEAKAEKHKATAKEERDADDRARDEKGRFAKDSADAGRVLRIDLAGGELRKPVKMSNGWLKVDGYLTRTGVFKYRNTDGTERLELRLPEDVFHADSLETFSMVPITDDHPPKFLDAHNTNEYQRGHIGEVVKRDGKMMRASMLITDSVLVEKIEKGRAVEISNGYSCDLDETPGVTEEGERYDAIQKNIRANHVAVVSAGRAGPEARVRMDSAAGVMVSISNAASSRAAKTAVPSGVTNVDKIKIDGVEYEAGSAQALAAMNAYKVKLDARADAMPEFIKKAIEKKKKKAAAEAGGEDEEEMEAEEEEEKKDSISARVEAEKQKARADAASEEADRLGKELKAAPARIAAEIKARMSLESDARVVLGSKVKLDAMTDGEIRRAALKKAMPDLKLDGKPDAYVDARFDIAIEEAKSEEHEDGIDDARRALRDDSDGESDPGDPSSQMTDADASGMHTDSATAYEAMCHRGRNAWKQPIGGEQA